MLPCDPVFNTDGTNLVLDCTEERNNQFEWDEPARIDIGASMTILEARRLNTDSAIHYLSEAGRYFAMYGDVINAVGMTEVFRDWGKLDEAHTALEQARTAFATLGLTIPT